MVTGREWQGVDQISKFRGMPLVGVCMFPETTKRGIRKTRDVANQIKVLAGWRISLDHRDVSEESNRMFLKHPIALGSQQCGDWTWDKSIKSLLTIDAAGLHVVQQPCIVITFFC